MRNNAGFTLIEFMIATLILMVGLLGMLNGVIIAAQRNQETTLRNEAIALADDQMMIQRSKNFANIVSVPKAATPRMIRGVQKSYSSAVTVTTPTANSCQISVLVTWNFRGTPKSHQISSAVANIQQ
jgi:type IV pilus assembly protein PilV